MSDTSIRVSDELADELYARKGRSTSYEEFIWELLAAVDGDLERDTGETDSAPTEVRERAVEQTTTAAEAELLASWTPESEANPERARSETLRALDWLRDHEGRASKSDFVAGLEFDAHVDSWWGRMVQPGLRELAEHGVVEYRPGHHDYKMLE